jgi:hypothetical protein
MLFFPIVPNARFAKNADACQGERLKLLVAEKSQKHGLPSAASPQPKVCDFRKTADHADFTDKREEVLPANDANGRKNSIKRKIIRVNSRDSRAITIFANLIQSPSRIKRASHYGTFIGTRHQ